MWLISYLATWLPSSFKKGKLPYMFFFANLIIVLLLVFAFISPYPYATPMFLAFAAFLVLLLVMVHHGLSLAWAVHIGTGSGALVLLYAIWFSGGSFSPRMTWLMVLPLTPFYVLGRKEGMAWLFIALALQVMVAALTGLEVCPPLPLGSEHAFSSWVTATAATGVLVIVPFLYARLYQKALEQGMRDQQALELKKRELEHALLMREHFVATVSHELRTPMNAILGFNAVLRDQVNTSAEDEQRVDMIRQSTQHLLALINDILDFSQLQAQRMQLGQEPYALHAGFEDIAKRLKHRAIEKKLQAICSIDPLLPQWVLIDHKRFSQLIDNLLHNALKFTNQGEIALHFKSCELGLRIEVKDSGIGMTPDQASHIFGRFEKVSMDPVHLYGGTGLGLSISEKLVQLQNGRIGVSSTLNQGSLFWVELPLLLTEAPHALNVEGESSGAFNNFPSVFLVVDDQAVNLLVAQRLLQKIWPECRVHTITSGQEALLWLKTNSVDMVLMDMFMPDMDGLEATHHIRSLNKPVNTVKIIGLTASSNANDHKQCLEAGMNDIVFKPLEQDALQTCVMRCWRSQP
jgi:signal transduction histidine kinase/ActR/RegA family two-component response regulator